MKALAIAAIALALAGCAPNIDAADKPPITRLPRPEITELTQQECIITKVTDGDTFDCTLTPSDTPITVRVIGIDAPETKDPRKPVQCYGPEATAQAKKLLTADPRVVLVYDDSQDAYDRYERTLAYVTIGTEDHGDHIGHDYGQAMISNGYAREYTYRKPYKNQRLYQNAERLAATQNRGLWKACKP